MSLNQCGNYGFHGFLPFGGCQTPQRFHFFLRFFLCLFQTSCSFFLSFLLLFLLDRGVGADAVLLVGSLGYALGMILSPVLTLVLDRAVD